MEKREKVCPVKDNPFSRAKKASYVLNEWGLSYDSATLIGGMVLNISVSPRLYHWFVRPRWFTKKYIHNHVQNHFHFNGQMILDFGSGTGANCPLFAPKHYIGLDPDAGRIEYAKPLYPDYTFQVFDRQRLPLDEQSVDCILIIAVLHHIASDEIAGYMNEFRRVLKPTGQIVVIEPYLCQNSPLCNRFMKWYDKGEYIRDEKQYIQLFQNDYQCTVLERFRKCMLYNELFFCAIPNDDQKQTEPSLILSKSSPV